MAPLAPGAIVCAGPTIVGLVGLRSVAVPAARERDVDLVFCVGISVAIQYLSVMPSQPPVRAGSSAACCP